MTVTGNLLFCATEVRFNGTLAPIVSTAPSEVHTTVPAGATSRPISVTSPGGTSMSAASFFVGETPIVSAAVPDRGEVGAVVVISGDHFTAATRVAFGPSSQAPFTLDSDTQITATMDAAATSGPISVTTLAATGASSFSFTVVPPDSFPKLAGVRDVPGDQGGKVTVAWLRSELDEPSHRLITGYRVWRRAPGVRYWEPIATLPSAFLQGYAYTAPTTQDSLPGSNPLTAFFVQALTANPLVFYNSAEDSGYSVDNLAPAPPQPATAVYGLVGVAIHWRASRDIDLRGYRIYRGARPNFVAGARSLLAAVADTAYFDASGSAEDYYKLSAVDVHGNESEPVLAAFDRAAIPGELQLVLSNPITSSPLELGFELPTDGPARLELLDISGRRIQALDLGALGAGAHRAALPSWRPIVPGVYVVRLSQGPHAVSRAIVVIR